jgi:GAF domain-containing protein
VINESFTETCAECQRVLAAAGPDEWLPTEREMIERHLATCQDCRDARERFAQTDAYFVEMAERESPADVLSLFSPAAAAALRELPPERVGASGHAALVDRLRAQARRAGPRRHGVRALLARGLGGLRALLAPLPTHLAYGAQAAYRPVPTRALTAHFRPRHRQSMHFMLAHFDTITGVLILLIVGAAVLPLIGSYPLFLVAPVGLLLYTAAMALLIRWSWSRRLWFEGIRKLKHRAHALARVWPRLRWLKGAQDDTVFRALQFAYALLLLAVAMMFIIQVHRYSLALHPPGEVTTAIWLLFSLPILWLSRYSSMGSIIVMTGFATLANATLPVFTGVAFDGRALFTQTMWIIVICLLPTMLARYIAETSAGMHAAVDVVKEIARIRADSDIEFVNVAASIIARRMDFEDVNILLPDDDALPATATARLRLVGAASARGRTLASERFTIPFGEGITGWAAAHRRERLVNDVLRDPAHIYVPHPLFSQTRAELAIPILVGNELAGVLDLQANQRYAFSEDDALLLRGVVMHLGVALRHFTMAQAQRETFVSPQITERMFRHKAVRPLLEEIVSVMREVLRADLVVLYPTKHSVQRLSDVVVEEPIWEGPLRTWVGSADSLSQQFLQSAVGQVLRSRTLKFLTHAQHDEALIASGHHRDGRPSFVEREGILSAAALPLRVPADDPSAAQGDRVLGAIFVNYRQPLIFTPDYQEQCRSLAALAAQALRQSQDYQEQVTLRKETANQLRSVSRDLERVRRLNRVPLELIARAGDPLVLVG